MKRRDFIKLGIGSSAAIYLSPLFAKSAKSELPFKISLAEWSVNKALFGRTEPKMDHLDFAKLANSFGITGLEYVNQFFMDKAKDVKYLAEMKKRADDYGCTSLLIMCDREGNLGDPNEKKRNKAVENHLKWLEAAKYLGCHSIRVNAYSEGTFEEQLELASDGLRKLAEKAQEFGLNVIVENHGKLTSDPDWLLGTIQKVNMPNYGMLPDFGNFAEHDPYRGVELLLPYAKGVSAKSQFNAKGECLTCDYDYMMRIVRDGGYNGFVGIESGASEGVDELQAIRYTKDLLERIRDEMMLTHPILGDTLDGWKKIKGGDWSLENGVLTGTNGKDWSTNPEESGSWLYFDKPVSDFKLEFQYMINEKGNSGVLFRSGLKKNPSFTGYEMQIYDCKRPEPTATCTPGAIYDQVTPSLIANRPANEWNTVTIRAQGRNIQIHMNGQLIIDADLDRSDKGYIGLQNHDEHSIIKFKNIRLQNL